ncbi:MAG TPA: alpha/beta hydrolase [Actinomycetota bacterium]
MPLVDGPACRLWVELLGEGEPVTVFVHGLSSTSEDLRALAAAVPGTRVLFDWRGHGRSDSPPPEAGYDHAAVAADLDAVAARSRATHAVGVSMGANAILRILCADPARFERAVLVMTSRLDDPAPDIEGTLHYAEHIETEPLEQLADGLLELPEVQMLIAREPRWREHIRAQLLRINPEGVPHALRAYATGEPPLSDPSCLGQVTTPLLVAGHERDPNHPAAVSRRIAELAPNATVRIWSDDFAMMLDDLEAFQAMVAAFLAGDPVPA